LTCKEKTGFALVFCCVSVASDTPHVIPAQAGIHAIVLTGGLIWIPACAGMTK
jgi:hypothetical protein